MTEEIHKIKMLQRHDLAQNWKTANPVLARGEIGFESDTGRFKIGNGTTRWDSLPCPAPKPVITYEVAPTDGDINYDLGTLWLESRVTPQLYILARTTQGTSRWMKLETYQRWDANKVLVSNTDGQIAAATVTLAELKCLAGVTQPLQGQINNIPQYNFLTDIKVRVNDTDTDTQVREKTNAEIISYHPGSKRWDACVAIITSQPSNIKKEILYYHNGVKWLQLHTLTTGTQRAEGVLAGIVANSEDITWSDGRGTIAAKFVKNNQIASASTLGLVKCPSEGGLTIDAEGALSIGASILQDSDTFIWDGGKA